MNSQKPRKIIAAALPGIDGGRALAVLDGAVGDGIGNAAVLYLTPEGRARLVESKDWCSGRAAVVGGLMGLLGGPIGALAGGVLGVLPSRLRDAGFDDGQLKEFGESLTPGTTAILVEVHEPALATALELLVTLNATRLVTVEIDADLSSVFEPVSAGA